RQRQLEYQRPRVRGDRGEHPLHDVEDDGDSRGPVAHGERAAHRARQRHVVGTPEAIGDRLMAEVRVDENGRQVLVQSTDQSGYALITQALWILSSRVYTWSVLAMAFVLFGFAACRGSSVALHGARGV